MVDFLIIAVLVLLVILLGIKYGLLNILAIVLAVIALIPFGVSLYLYYARSPMILYQVASKVKIQEGNKQNVYDLWLGLQCKNGKVILERVAVAPESGVAPSVHPDSTEAYTIELMLEEADFVPVLTLQPGRALYDKTGFIYRLRFTSEIPRASFLLRVIVDVSVDPYKLGFWSVFQPNHRYRLSTEIPVSFQDLTRQEGQLVRRW